MATLVKARSLWLATTPIDMRCGIDRLTLLVQDVFDVPWQGGAAFVFRNRAGSRIKILHWDDHGAWLCQRRLHHGKFHWPTVKQKAWPLTQQQYAWLVLGVDWLRLQAVAVELLATIQHQSIEAASYIDTIQAQAKQLNEKELKIQALILEIARLKRLKFAQKAETYHGKSLESLEETIDTDIAAAETALGQLIAAEVSVSVSDDPKRQPKRRVLPNHLVREQVRHAPVSEHCLDCGEALRFIRDEITEQLDYQPATFKVIEHIRPQYSCPRCETVVSEPMPAQIIDKGVPGPGLLAQILIAKYAEHCPLTRQRVIYQRSGVDIAVSTMAQ